MIWVLAPLIALLAAHLAVLAFAVFSLAWPNPARVFKRHGTPEQWGLRAEEVRLSNGCPGWSIVHPGAPGTVLVLHGRSRDRSWMLPLLERLAREYNVLAVDFPGHGGNRYAPSSIGPEEASTVHAALDWLEAHGHRAVVVHGVSMGGAAAIFALASRPRSIVRGLITDGTYADLVGLFRFAARGTPVPRWLFEVALSAFRRVTGVDPYRARTVDAVGGIGVSMEFLHGDRDPLAPVESASALERASGGRGVARIYAGLHDEPTNPAKQALVMTAVKRMLGG